MKKKFSYCFEPRDSDLNSIWKDGILTTDTNVLLDLYRYHKDTRDNIISNLKKFEGELWLSHQAASEFFKNRKNVIISSEKTFQDAINLTDQVSLKLGEITNTLKGNRIIPKEIAEKLKSSIEKAAEESKEEILKIKSAYPKYLDNDDILETIANLFDGKTGDEPSNLKEIIEIAKERIKNSVPPGYKDAGKENENPCGDYILWSQLLEHSKKTNKPLILITSERKEDWWEIIKGKTVGPRPELLKEAIKETGNHILIYQTETFIKIASEKYGKPADKSIINDIIEVSKQRIGHTHAIEVINHRIEEQTKHCNKGAITVKLIKPVMNFTVSRGFRPNLTTPPEIEASLLRSPTKINYKITASTGTVHDFNIHIISGDRNILPIGVYEIKYEARTKQQQNPTGELQTKTDSNKNTTFICNVCHKEKSNCKCDCCVFCDLPKTVCSCAHCDNCGEALFECNCERCEKCDEITFNCNCERCWVCSELIENCCCERCEHCSELTFECSCEFCDKCGKNINDCTCEDEVIK
ncbi:PIN domain-containing protein [Morganella morganii]|uniref:PIN-like domain-containing protein n=1 Tax=Morganella morganii TaxID=582 RepID=UPI0032DB94AA